MTRESFDSFYREFSSISGSSLEDIDIAAVINGLRSLSGAALVTYIEITDDQKSAILKALSTKEELLEKNIEILGSSPIGTTYELDARITEFLSRESLTEVADILQLAESHISRYACTVIRKTLKVGRSYIFGFKTPFRLLAAALIVMREGDDLQSPEMVELLCRHVQVILQRQYAMEMSVLNILGSNRDGPCELGSTLQAIFQAADTLPDLIYQLDPNGRIIFINRAAQRYGYLQEELLGTSILDIVHPDDREGAYWHLRERRRGERRTHDFEVRILTGHSKVAIFTVHDRSIPSDVVFSLESEGLYKGEANQKGFYGTIGICRDITREKRLNLELDHQFEIFRSVTENVGDAVWVEQREPRKFIYANPAAEALYGILLDSAREDTEGWLSNVFPEDRERVLDFFQELEHGERKSSIEYRIFDEKGRETWIFTRIFPVFDDDGRVDQLIGIATDITKRKKETQKLEQRLAVEQEYMRELNHRVKNNLAMIDSMLNLELYSTSGDEKTTGILQNVKGRIEAVRLVHEMLQGNTREKKVEITGYLRSLTDSLCETVGCINQNTRIEYLMDQSVWLPVRLVIPLGMILNELVTNAFKYAFPDQVSGTIWVRFSTLSSGYYRLEVKDNGVELSEGTIRPGEGHIGMELIDVLSEQIDGTFAYEKNDDSKSFSVTFSS